MPAATTYTTLKEDVRAYLERGQSAAQDPTVYDQIPRLIGMAERRIARELKIQGFQETVTGVFSSGTAVYDKPDRWRETISINVGSGKNTVTGATVVTAGSGYLSAPTVTASGGGGSGAAFNAFVLNGTLRRIAVASPGSGYTSAPTLTLSGGAATTQGTATAAVSLDYNQRNPVKPLSYEALRRYWPDDTQTGMPIYYADYDYQHWIFAPTPNANDLPFEVLYWQLPPLLDDANQTNWVTEYAPNLLLYASLLESAPFLKDDGRINTWQGLYDRALQALMGEDIRKIVDRQLVRQE